MSNEPVWPGGGGVGISEALADARYVHQDGTGLPNSVVRATSFLLPSGGDDSAAIQTVITTNCDVVLSAGTFLLNTASITLPAGATRVRIRGAGVGATVLQLNATSKRAFDMPTAGTPSVPVVYQNIEITDLTVDCNNVVSATKEHVILGNLIGGNWTNWGSYQNIRVERVAAVNVPTSQDANGRQVISVRSTHPAGALPNAPGDNTEIQTLITDWVIRDVTATGGMMGLALIGGGASAVNVWHDRIWVERFRWDSGKVMFSNPGVAAGVIQIGGDGFGDVCTIRDCTGANSSDVGIEVDCMLRLLVEGCRMQDCTNSHFFVTNFNTPQDKALNNRLNSQVATFRDCHAVVENLIPSRLRTDAVTLTQGSATVLDTAITAGDQGRPIAQSSAIPAGTYVGTVVAGVSFLLSSSSTSQVDVLATAAGVSLSLGYGAVGFNLAHNAEGTYNHVILEDSTYTCKGARFTWNSGSAINAFTNPIQRITIRDFTAIHDNVADPNGATSVGPSVIAIAPSVSCVTSIDGIRVVVAGTCGTGMAPRLVILASGANGADNSITYRRARVGQSLTGITAGNTILHDIGNGVAGGTYSLLAEDFKVITAAGDTKPTPWYFRANATNNISTRGVTLASGDHSAITDATGFDVAGTSANRPDSTIAPLIRVLPGYKLASTRDTGAYGPVAQQNYKLLTANGTWTVPPGVTQFRARVVSGGGGGGGAASTATQGRLQSGGGGGAGGTLIDQIFAANPGDVITAVIGAGGSSGIGGTGGSVAGGNGGNGGSTILTNTTQAATLISALGGAAGRGSADGTSTAAGGIWGTNGSATTGTATAGGGGIATSSSGVSGAPMLSVVGGAAGGSATASVGGGGGGAQTTALLAVQAVGAASGTINGVNGVTATQPGCGGGGGGGGANTAGGGSGTGGNGGLGAPGQVEIWW